MNSKATSQRTARKLCPAPAPSRAEELICPEESGSPNSVETKVKAPAELIAERPSLRPDLSFLLNYEEGDTYEFEIPARPFVGVTEDDVKDIVTLVRRSITEPGRPPGAKA